MQLQTSRRIVHAHFLDLDGNRHETSESAHKSSIKSLMAKTIEKELPGSWNESLSELIATAIIRNFVVAGIR